MGKVSALKVLVCGLFFFIVVFSAAGTDLESHFTDEDGDLLSLTNNEFFSDSDLSMQDCVPSASLKSPEANAIVVAPQEFTFSITCPYYYFYIAFGRNGSTQLAAASVDGNQTSWEMQKNDINTIVDILGSSDEYFWGIAARTNAGGLEFLSSKRSLKFGSQIEVRLSPTDAISDGARWRIGTGDWRDIQEESSGCSCSSQEGPDPGDWRQNAEKAVIEAGTYQIYFKNIKGWETPLYQSVELELGETKALTALYTESGCGSGIFKMNINKGKGLSDLLLHHIGDILLIGCSLTLLFSFKRIC